MKRLRFDELWLASSKERRARRVKFHEKVTAIKGDNQTGKSALLKSLYSCLGADPAKTPQDWLDLEVRCLLKFRIDDRKYSILKDSRSFTLLDAAGRVTGVYRSVARQLGPRLAELFDFRLELPSRTGDPTTPPPANLFAPFYIDQDTGWKDPWGSLARLRRSVRKDVLEYQVGIKPNDYYTIKARMRDLQQTEMEPRLRRTLLEQMVNDVDQRISSVTFDIDPESFRTEIDRLLAQCEGLQQTQSAIKSKLVEYGNLRAALNTQLRVVRGASHELGRDFHYAVHLNTDHVECPLCGASYDNGFLERFDIARDEDRCIELESELQQELDEANEQIQVENAKLAQTSERLTEIGAILEARQGEVTLRDLIQREGKREIRGTLAADLQNVRATLASIGLQIQDNKRRMRTFLDSSLRTSVMGDYSTFMHEFAARLQVFNLSAEVFTKIDPAISVSGSPEPRAILTYFMSILHLVAKRSTATFCPVVVDSVNNNGQDRGNLNRMLTVLRDHLPDAAQLVVAFVDAGGVEFPGEVIELNEERGLLQVSEYRSAVEMIRPLYDLREAFLAERESAEDDASESAEQTSGDEW